MTQELLHREHIASLGIDARRVPVAQGVRAYVLRSELGASATPREPGSYLAIEHVAGQTAHEAQLRESMRRDLERMRRKYDSTDMFLEMAQEVFAT